jgi:hypothetical protein
VTFAVHALRFHFLARESIHFPPGKSGNIVRGAFGSIFRKLVCVPECAGAKSCPLAGECAYARIFEPASAGGPSGLADPPRPFVFRAHQLDGHTIPPGGRFFFDVHLFYPQDTWLAYFVLAFDELAASGLGPGRGRAQLTTVLVLDGDRREVEGLAACTPIEIPLDPEPASHVLVRFLTPTELKVEGMLAQRPDFPALFSRARDRISTLRGLYGPGSLDIDFRAMADRAGRICMTRCDVVHESYERRSSRTGQTHPLGGFTGEAEYEGELGEFIPFLRAAQWTGVGRQTVWGKGAIEVEPG